MFVAREGRRLSVLMQAMASAKGGEAVFERWMLQQSDAVQACALGYAEREVLDACTRTIQQVRGRCQQVAGCTGLLQMCGQTPACAVVVS